MIHPAKTQEEARERIEALYESYGALIEKRKESATDPHYNFLIGHHSALITVLKIMGWREDE